ncbi:hypothetical protein [Pseudofrankia asymbiotica]|uniref:Uncharacterized protein n=1 Tax=Pseudofrankia asymbiotica TaxID=1834516 RepID=A0A1V2I9K2_9ACTN|nr:hypothetical protein [Pseudofrankia asymbiotica]ONH29128.1 hypothetical protein BL253_17065 [Pseudofrankia asymbiotica]
MTTHTTRLERRLKAELTALTKTGDTTPGHLHRHTPLLVSLLTGRRTLAAAADAADILTTTATALPDPADDAARALLGIGQPPLTTLTARRETAGNFYRGVTGDWFHRKYEAAVIDTLIAALIERADPSATYPDTPIPGFRIPRLAPPPLSAFVPRRPRRSA